MTWPTKTDFVDGNVLTAAQVNNIGTNLNEIDPTGVTDGYVITADGANGLAWEALPPSGGWVTITSGTLPTGASSVTFTSIPQTYKQLVLYFQDWRPATNNVSLRCRINNVSAGNYQLWGYTQRANLSPSLNDQRNQTEFTLNTGWSINNTNDCFARVVIDNYTSAEPPLVDLGLGFYSGGQPYNSNNWGYCWGTTAAVTQIEMFLSFGNFNAGTYVLYGVS